MVKNVLVIGSSGGMGKAIVNKLLSEGYKIFGIDIIDEKNTTNLTYFKCDITNENSLINVFNAISKDTNKLDAIVFVSGIYKMDSLLEISDEEMKKIIDINVLSVQRINRIFFSLLGKGSKIVITTSELSVLDPLPFNGIYSISKSFLEKYAFSLRMEVNNYGIKVVTLRPGAVATSMINASTSSLNEFVDKTTIHKNSSQKFKRIVDSVEAKAINPEKLAKLMSKILKKKNPKYSYSINRNFGLRLLNFLPDKLQVAIISKLIK